MFRIDGPGAVGELPPVREGVSAPGFFGPGNPATGQMSTRVTYEWLNAVQEELMAVLEAAGVAPDKSRNDRLLEALKGLFASINAQPYELCEFYAFRHPTLREGFQPAQGGVVQNADSLYPEAWDYLQTEAGQLLCLTETAWQAMSTATFYTLSDGSKIGWNGIGGVPYYVLDTAAKTLRLPDLRGMYMEAAGFDSLGVGGVHGDGIRRLQGRLAYSRSTGGMQSNGLLYWESSSDRQVSAVNGNGGQNISLDTSRVVPTAPANRPRAWGALACVYLGVPAS